MKLSVIVPVYNVEGTLRRCLGSLTRQSVPDMEIIMVDDGSTDGSLAICRDFADSRDNAVIVSQCNAGLGAARNAGIAVAHGEWIYFIDSDDELAEGTLGAVLDEAEKTHADIVEFPYLTIYPASSAKSMGIDFAPECLTAYSPTDYWLKTRAWRHTYAWNKVYRRELFDTLKWAEGVRFEDAFTLPLLLKSASAVAVTNVGRYYYHKNEAGLTATATSEHTEQLLTAQWETLKRLLNDYGEQFRKDHEKTLGEYYADIVNIQITALMQGAREPMLPILPYWHTAKLKLLHMVGFKNLARLCSFLS